MAECGREICLWELFILFCFNFQSKTRYQKQNRLSDTSIKLSLNRYLNETIKTSQYLAKKRFHIFNLDGFKRASKCNDRINRFILMYEN